MVWNLDVAVLRCLFISHWQEDGVYWCLHYLYSRYVEFHVLYVRFSTRQTNNHFFLRLREMSEEAIPPQPQPRRRSNSLPIPHIEISVYQGPGTNSRDSPTGSSITKDFIEIPDQPVSALVTGNFGLYFIRMFARQLNILISHRTTSWTSIFTTTQRRDRIDWSTS